MNHLLNLAIGRAAAIVLLWFTSFSGVAAEPDRISLAYCSDCVPFHFQDKDGRPAGLIIDIWRLWSERTGIEIDFRTAPWDKTLRMVADGAADAHAGLFFNDRRAAFLEYGATLTRTDTHYFVKKGLPPIESVDDLAGYRVGVLAGDFVEQFLQKTLPARDIIGFKNYAGIMTALREGKLQIFAADTPTGIFHLQNAGLGFDYVFPADRPLYSNDWLVAARKGDAELIRVINAGMALVTAPERREIEQRWVALGTKGFALTTQDIIALVALLGIAFTVGVLIWNRTLQRRIERRTGELETELGQRRRAEEEVRKVWDAIEELSEGFALYDSDDRLVKCNQRYREIFSGIAQMLVPGTSFEEILDAAVAGNIFSNQEDAESWKRARIEEHHQPSEEGLLQRAHDGRWILIKEHRTADGGYLGIRTDVTELKRAEQELAESQERLQALADYMQVALSSMSDGIYILDGDLNIVAFNQRYVDLLNFPEGLVREGGSIVDVTEFAAKRGDYGSQFDGDIDDIVAGRLKQLQSDEEFLIENVTPAGRLVEYRGSPIIGGGFVTIIHDITERKQAAEALEEAYEVIKNRSDRMEDELNIAREIQMSMVPLIFPPFPIHDEFSIFAILEPAREIGGDFYDFYFIDEDHLCLCIGDVSGKGVPAALFMAVAKTLIKSRAGDDHSTASVLTHVNDELSADNKSHMFVTIFVAILNIGTGELVYTNAGHNPPYLKRADGTLIRLDRRHGPVVAAVEGMVYEEGRDRMAPGDLLMLYTDGVTEAHGPEDQLFSEGRLRDLLASMNAPGVERAVAETVAAVRAFEQETEQADDITLLALEFHGSSHDSPLAERRIVIENRLPNIAVVNETFDAFAEEFGIPKLVTNKFNLAFDDLLNNVITFAYRDDSEHEIEINIERAKNRLTATITDDGVPFNPLGADIPDTTLSLSDRDTGGLGIHLVRNLVDEMSYQRRIDRNVVTITSHLDAEAGPSPDARPNSRREPPEPIE